MCYILVCDLFSFRFAHEYIAITMQLLGATAVLKNEIRSLLLISNGKAFHRSIVECKKNFKNLFSQCCTTGVPKAVVCVI